MLESDPELSLTVTIKFIDDYENPISQRVIISFDNLSNEINFLLGYKVESKK